MISAKNSLNFFVVFFQTIKISFHSFNHYNHLFIHSECGSFAFFSTIRGFLLSLSLGARFLFVLFRFVFFFHSMIYIDVYSFIHPFRNFCFLFLLIMMMMMMAVAVVIATPKIYQHPHYYTIVD